jgi:COP9 signalosome complex subunit 6
MANSETANPLVLTTPGTDTSPQIQLHPLVLLTISDYVTRHVLRKQEGPIVGAIIGQQTGREVTMEVAFECKTQFLENGNFVLDEAWFQERLEQCELPLGHGRNEGNQTEISF